MSEVATAASFEALVGSSFTVVGEWGRVEDAAPGDGSPAPELASDGAQTPSVELTLVRVEVLPLGGPFEQFRATFEGPISTPLDQGTFVIDPPASGLDALLLVPTADREDVRVYTASLSVLRPSTESTGP